jgi:tetratricopeptide (TPR) repeat protein
MAEGVTDLERAAALQPQVAVRWQELGILRSRQAERLAARGADPFQVHRAAVDDLDRAVRLAPLARISRGHALLNWGIALMNRGQDPRERFAKAKEDLDAAVAALDRNDEAWLRRGSLFYHLGVIGEDARANYDRAERDYRAALAINPRRAEIHLMIGIARTNLGFEKLGAGEDALPDFAAAEAALGDALKLKPTAQARRVRGGVRINISQAQINAGADGLQALVQAVEDLSEVVRTEAKDAEGWLYLGHAYMNLGSLREKKANYTLALRAYEECVRLVPGLASQCAPQTEWLKKELSRE